MFLKLLWLIMVIVIEGVQAASINQGDTVKMISDRHYKYVVKCSPQFSPLLV